MRARVHSKRSWRALPIVLGVCGFLSLQLVAGSTSIADEAGSRRGSREPWVQLGRSLGIGWGDGYHTCQGRGARPAADRPPATFYASPYGPPQQRWAWPDRLQRTESARRFGHLHWAPPAQPAPLDLPQPPLDLPQPPVDLPQPPVEPAAPSADAPPSHSEAAPSPVGGHSSPVGASAPEHHSAAQPQALPTVEPDPAGTAPSRVRPALRPLPPPKANASSAELASP